MTQWEYRSSSILSDNAANILGQQGWEAYAVYNGYIFFKRKL